MFDVEGFILVGGQSRRMGRDKAQLILAGQTLIDRITGELSGVTSRVALVGAREQHPNFVNIPDVHESWGALGGLHAALKAATTGWVIVVGCDLPFVTRALFERLLTFVSQDFDAIVPMQADGRPQPVCALYRVATCLPEIEKLIALGEHTPRALLTNVSTRFIDSVELADLPAAENFFLNVNTPEDFEVAQAIARTGNSRSDASRNAD
jgi:molybdopterin-guanine dinucleotide biosynthesis protein A